MPDPCRARSLPASSSASAWTCVRTVRLDLPDQSPLADTLWLPFQSARHPATDAIAEGSLAWLRQHGLVTDRNERVFRRARFHDLAGRVYHRADVESLRAAADFIATLFVLDDLMDTSHGDLCRDPVKARDAMDGLSRAARTGRPSASRGDGLDGVASALADLTDRLRGRRVRLGAYLDELDVYLDGVVEETERRQRHFTGVADYADVRVSFSAVYACIELGLAFEGTCLPPHARNLAHAANLSVSWVNDLYSWPKERVLGEPSNLIRVVADERGCGEAEAFHLACRACDEVVARYLAARPAFFDRDGRAVLDLLESWMQGNYDWHASGTARYTEHLSVAPDRAGGRPPRARPEVQAHAG